MRYTGEEALGLVETMALVPAVEAADKMLKAAAVELVAFEAGGSTLCTVFVAGDVASCRAAVTAGAAAAEAVGVLTSKNVMPRPIGSIRAIVNTHALETDAPVPWEALGLVGTFGVVSLMEAADAMCKAAPVELVGYENVYDGYVSVLVGGGTADCETAVAAGVEAVRNLGGKTYSSTVIPSPHPDLGGLISRYTIDGWST